MKNEQKSENTKANKDMSFTELIEKFPKSTEILINHGLHCIGCMMARVESVEQGCKSHGMNDEQINKLIEEINGKVPNKKADN